jgi:hypothetical protein
VDEQQLAELEMHLAAGTDLPTALAAVQREEAPRATGKRLYLGLTLATILVFLWIVLT